MKETENSLNRVLDSEIIMYTKVSVVDLENRKKIGNVEESG